MTVPIIDIYPRKIMPSGAERSDMNDHDLRENLKELIGKWKETVERFEEKSNQEWLAVRMLKICADEVESLLGY